MSWQDAIVGPDASIRNAMAALDKGSIQMCLIVDESRKLIGAVTDGDIRRAILSGAVLEAPAEGIMVKSPFTKPADTTREELQRQMNILKIRQIPLLDEVGCLVDLAYIDDLQNVSERRQNEVVLMAGGRGVRLRPLTDDTPKPLLKVGEKPILETIISRFLDQGFQKFKISVNYRADMIRGYFGDGAWLGAEIEYLEEPSALGTAGALSLLRELPSEPTIVMNGDVLTQIDFGSLLTYHEEHSAAATMALREFGMQVPFGVVDVNNHRITGISEKPSKQFLVNAGIYVLSPEVISLIPADKASDMTDLFQTLIDSKQYIAAFPIHEYWMDVGRAADFDKATEDFDSVFGLA